MRVSSQFNSLLISDFPLLKLESLLKGILKYDKQIQILISVDPANFNPIPHGGVRFCPHSDCLFYNFR